MSPRRYPPAYLRYLRARLSNLGRPAFWGTAIFLSVLGLGIREYWANPDFATFLQNNNRGATQKPVDLSLSDEERAIAADIDNLPVLISDSERAIAPKTTDQDKSQVDKGKNFLDELISKQQQAANNAKSNSAQINNNVPTPKLTNPFVTQAENLLQAGINNNSQLFGVNSSAPSSQPSPITGSFSNFGFSSANQTNNAQNPAPISALQTALDATNQKPLSSNNTTSNQTNALGRSLSNQNQSTTTGLNPNPNPINNTNTYTQPPVTNQQPNLYNNNSLNQPITNQQLNYNNNNSFNPAAGTGYTQPIPNQQPNLYNNSGNQAQGNQQPNLYNNLTNVQPLPSVVTPTSVASPVTNAPSSSVQTPTQSYVQPINQAGYGNSNGNPSLPQTQSSQSNLIPPLAPGQYGGVNINGKTYP